LFEFWRRFGRISLLVLSNTPRLIPRKRGQPDFLRRDVLEHGVEPFIESMLPKPDRQTLEPCVQIWSREPDAWR
jgi:hypothetical protein